MTIYPNLSSLVNYWPAFVDLTDLASEECARVAAHLELGPDPLSIVLPGVAKLRRRMLRNLRENAWRYGTPDIEVQLPTLNDNNRSWIRLCVCDRGPSVPIDLRERIIKPF
jgi:signal transduction histidine kinase